MQTTLSLTLYILWQYNMGCEATMNVGLILGLIDFKTYYLMESYKTFSIVVGATIKSDGIFTVKWPDNSHIVYLSKNALQTQNIMNSKNRICPSNFTVDNIWHSLNN